MSFGDARTHQIPQDAARARAEIESRLGGPAAATKDPRTGVAVPTHRTVRIDTYTPDSSTQLRLQRHSDGSLVRSYQVTRGSTQEASTYTLRPDGSALRDSYYSHRDRPGRVTHVRTESQPNGSFTRTVTDDRGGRRVARYDRDGKRVGDVEVREAKPRET